MRPYKRKNRYKRIMFGTLPGRNQLHTTSTTWVIALSVRKGVMFRRALVRFETNT